MDYDPDEVDPVLEKVWDGLFGPDASGAETVHYQPGQPVKPARARAGFPPQRHEEPAGHAPGETG